MLVVIVVCYVIFDLFGLLQCGGANKSHATHPSPHSSLLTLNVSSNEFVFKKTKEEIIYCLPLRGGLPIEGLTVTWYKNNTEIKDLPDSGRFKVLPDNSLLITKPRRLDAALYTVVFHEANKGVPNSVDGMNCSFGYFARPLVLHLATSYNVERGKELNLGCTVLAYPPTVVSWYMNDHPLSENDSRISTSTWRGHENAYLTMTSVQITDDGIYNCTAYSFFFNASSSQTTHIRVTDSLDFLIPLVALVAGFIILSLIILTFEAHAKDRIRKKEEGLYRESFLNLAAPAQ